MSIVTRGARAAAALVLAGALAPAVFAQSEWVYGPTARVDEGARRVSPVSTLCGGGFVSVGTSSTSTTSDIYVVRTTAAGGPIWERLYDLGPGRIDRGESIVALRAGNGFVVAGSSRTSAGDMDAVLLRIDCAGNVVWANTYLSGTSEGAFDVIEARSGDAAFSTAVGDLIAAGFATSTSTDAMIFRVRNNGAMIWNRRYDLGGAREQFRALVEARPIAPALTGDIVVAGWIDPGTGQQGYVARVNGNNGGLGVGPQCAAHYGDTSPQRFEAVTDLVATTGLVGQFVFGGMSFGPNTSNDIYLLRTQASPCLPLQQRRIGASASAVLGDEQLFGLSEVRVTMSPAGIAPLGSLALTGYAGNPLTAAADNDATLLITAPTSLAPLLGSGRLYGDHLTLAETGISVSPTPAGFTLTGFNAADPQALGDARDLYLVKADTNGNTTCQAAWNPPHSVPLFPVTPVTPVIVAFMTQTPVAVTPTAIGTAFQSCP
jgi:hypothetical protein